MMYPRRSCTIFLAFIAAFTTAFCLCAIGHAANPPQYKVSIDNQPISEDELAFQFFLNQLPETATEADRLRLINKAVDRILVKRFLQFAAIEPSQAALDQEVSTLLKATQAKGQTTQEVLNQLGLDEQKLRGLLWTDAAWKTYASTVVSRGALLAEWDMYRNRYDGTRVKASQIILRLPPDAKTEKIQSALSELHGIHEKIANGELTFAEAARQYSQSPSGQKGGDLGEFEYYGRVAEEISSVAFQLSPGQISDPFRTRFGVHLLLLTDKLEGQFSIEDAKPEIYSRLSNRMWDEIVMQQREKHLISVQR